MYEETLTSRVHKQLEAAFKLENTSHKRHPSRSTRCFGIIRSYTADLAFTHRHSL